MSGSFVRSTTVIALVLTLLTPHWAGASVAAGAESPQALVARLNAAAAANDFGELAACLAPEERAVMTVMMAVMGGVMIAFMGMGGEMATGIAEGMAEGVIGEELDAEQEAAIAKAKAEIDNKGAQLQKRYEAILAEYGLDKRLAEAGKSGEMGMGELDGPNAAKARELLEGIDDVALLRDLMMLFEELGEGSEKKESPVQVPKDVSDYRIEGDTATAKSGQETVSFVKVDGRWYFKPEEKKGEPE
jgi:hypothetical protein